MGAGAWWSKGPPVYAKKRRAPLTTAEEILKSVEGKERLQSVMDSNLPGTVFRWEKIVKMLNIDLAPTETQRDPIRIVIDEVELKRMLKLIYNGVESAINDRIVLMRKFIPQLYDKHSVERARKVSQQERNENRLIDEAYVYGELDYEIFATMYEKLSRAYGLSDNGMFYDLGCGVGHLVYTAAMISLNKFNRCGGIEIIGNLLDRAVKRMARWDNVIKPNFPKEVRSVQILWDNEDIYKNDNWINSTFIFIHWTAFSNIQLKDLAVLLCRCKEGTQVITVTHPIPNIDDHYEILIKDECITSWGSADFYFHEKLKPPKVY